MSSRTAGRPRLRSAVRRRSLFALLTGAVLLTGMANGSSSAAPSAQPAPAVPAAVTLTALPRHSTILADTRRAADYYRQTSGLTTLKPANGWSWSTYTQGIQALYRQSGDQRYLDDNMSWGRSALWAISTRETNPDTVKAGQTYFDLQAIDPAASLTGIDATMSTDLASQPISKYDWIDALFMGLGNFPRWAVRTGNQAYLANYQTLPQIVDNNSRRMALQHRHWINATEGYTVNVSRFFLDGGYSTSGIGVGYFWDH